MICAWKTVLLNLEQVTSGAVLIRFFNRNLQRRKEASVMKAKNEEMKKVNGGEERYKKGYFRCTNPNCPVHYRKLDCAPDYCLDCGFPMEWVQY